MLRSPSVSSSHGLLPVLHGWQHVSQHVAEVFCLKINAILPVNMKNISTERFFKYDCAVVKMLQKALLWQCFLFAQVELWQWLGSPSLCFVFRSGLSVRSHVDQLVGKSSKYVCKWHVCLCLATSCSSLETYGFVSKLCTRRTIGSCCKFHGLRSLGYRKWRQT